MATEKPRLRRQEFRLALWTVDEVNPHSVASALAWVIDPATERLEVAKEAPGAIRWTAALGQPAPEDEPNT